MNEKRNIFPSSKAKRKNVERAIQKAAIQYSHTPKNEIPNVIHFWDDSFIELADCEHVDLIMLAEKTREDDERENSDKTCPCCGGSGVVE